MKAFVLHCPHLERDQNPLLARVPNVQVLTGYPVVPGEKGCVEMHKRAISIGMDSKEAAIAVFEDDCGFYDNFDWKEWCSFAEWAWLNEYGAVHGGSVLTTNARRTSHPKLLSVDKACSAHCMIYTVHGYEAAMRAENPFDLNIGNEGIRPLIALPYVAYQRAGLSGIGAPMEVGESKIYSGPKHVDYEGFFRMHEQHLASHFSIAIEGARK